MRYWLVALVGMLAFSCREILPLVEESTIQGYQLNGTVTTANGIPLDSVRIQLYYNYDIVSFEPIDTQQVVVVNPARIVDVAVYTPSFQFVRQLYLGYRPVGPVPRFRWDGFDRNGVAVPSGKYLVRYVLDTVIVKYSPVITDGHLTTLTDGKGIFTLPADRLPIGERFDIYNETTNSYIGTYAVRSIVDLIFRKSTLRAVYSGISLQKGKIVTKTFILQ